MKPLDTHYLLDEIEILGHLVERIASHSGLLMHGEGIHGVRMSTEHTTRHTAALFQELRERREARQRLTSYEPRSRRHHEIDFFAKAEELFDALRVLPSEDAMRAILSSHRIERLAKTMKIEESLIHSAVASGPRAINKRPIIQSIARRRPGAEKPVFMDDEIPLDDLSGDADSWAPYLPEPIRVLWANAVASTIADIKDLYKHELITAYEAYLQWVLDCYATGENGGSTVGLAGYNELADRNGLTVIYKDTFWYRSAKILSNPDYDSNKPWHPASKTVENKPINAPYIIEIEFEPRGILNTDFVISLWDTRTGTPPAHILEALGAVKEGYHFVAVESRGVHGEDPIRMATGRTKLEAYTILVAGEREHTSTRRPLTEQEQEELRKAASAPVPEDTFKTVKDVQQFTQEYGDRAEELKRRHDLLIEIGDYARELKTSELDGLYNALVTHKKYGIPEHHEFVAHQHFEPTPKYTISFDTTEKEGRAGKARWFFSNEGLWLERARMLSGLCALRGGLPEKSDRDTETNKHYVLPYSMDEMQTIFGRFEELT